MATMASISLNMGNFATLYYLQHSNLPSTMLVSHVLTGDNYHTWSRLMQMALKAKKKIRFMNGLIVQPSMTDPTYEV